MMFTLHGSIHRSDRVNEKVLDLIVSTGMIEISCQCEVHDKKNYMSLPKVALKSANCCVSTTLMLTIACPPHFHPLLRVHHTSTHYCVSLIQ